MTADRAARAIAATPGDAQPRFVPSPPAGDPGPGQVLCRTLELGVCGTDREILESMAPLVPRGASHLVLGHECLARVEAIGPPLDEVGGDGPGDWLLRADGQRVAVGDLVVPVVRRAAVESTVRVDLLAFGQYTERGIVEEHGFSAESWLDQPRHLFGVPGELASLAVLTEPLSVAEKGVNEALAIQRGRLGPQAWTQPPPRVLVTGLGPIGFAGVLACWSRGWPTTLYGRDETDTFRAELGQRWGARYVAAREAARWSGSAAPEFDLILECTGSDSVMVATARWLAPRGVMVWLGSSRQPQAAEHNLARLMRDGVLRNQVHVGSVNAAPRDFRDALVHLAQAARTHRACVEALVTARVEPEAALWHFEHRQPQGIKTVVVYDDAG